MDVVFGFTGDKFAVIVTDTMSVQQIIVQKDDTEKTIDLDSHKLMALSGPKGDCVYFGEYIQANMKLYELKNGCKLSTHAAANFTRNNLAEALRSGPYQVNILLAGYDPDEDECSLYFMDYLASMQKVNSGKEKTRISRVPVFPSDFCRAPACFSLQRPPPPPPTGGRCVTQSLVAS